MAKRRKRRTSPAKQNGQPKWISRQILIKLFFMLVPIVLSLIASQASGSSNWNIALTILINN